MNDVRETVDGFACARTLYQKTKIPYRRGLLFFGPPGNGKSLICRSIISSLRWPTITMARVGASFVAENVQRAFNEATALAPAILWLEDVDILLGSEVNLSAFLNMLDGCDTREGLLVLATTNHPERLHEGLTSRPSRFDRVFCITTPELTERDRYLNRLFGTNLAENERKHISELTSGMSFAFLKEIFVGAATSAFRRGEQPRLDDALAMVAIACPVISKMPKKTSNQIGRSGSAESVLRNRQSVFRIRKSSRY